jgi:anti-anti-sigma regulatory factor
MFFPTKIRELTNIESEPPRQQRPWWQLLLGAFALVLGMAHIGVSLRYPSSENVVIPYQIGAMLRTLFMIAVGWAMLTVLRWRQTTTLEQRKGTVLIILASMFALLIGIVLLIDRSAWPAPATVLGYIVMILIMIQIVVLARHGQIILATTMMVLWWFTQVLINMSVSPLSIVFPVFTICILLAGLLSRWWVGIALTLAFPVLYLTFQQLGWLEFQAQDSLALLMFCSVMLFSIASITALYTRSLEQALRSADSRAAELAVAQQILAEANTSLEERVSERTAALEQSLATQASQAETLVASLAEQQRLNQTINDLSFPIIPVRNDALVLPLVGILAEQRANDLLNIALQQVQDSRARVLFLDVTGVAIVDTLVAEALLRVATAVRLLGATTVLVGIRPEVAQTLVSLGSDMSQLRTAATLQAGLEAMGIVRQG